MNKVHIELEADQLHSGKWAVRPIGQLGTCGWYPEPWTIQYVSARSESEAIKVAKRNLERKAAARNMKELVSMVADEVTQ
jgi:hypothetical protein